MLALVTGAGGFLGRYIAEQLIDQGDQVRAFSRGEYPALREIGIETIQGDVRDAAALRNACDGVDAVFHTAAVAGIWGPWSHYYEINTLGTQHVIAACQHHGVRKLVFSSSPSVTFEGRDQCGVDESAPYAQRWLCHYPHTKALAEQQVLAANAVAGVATCSLRPHLIWGPRDQHLIPRLIDRARRGKLVQVGRGQNLIDVIYVENAAQAHLQAAAALESPKSPVAGQAYFLSQGEPVNCWQWINELLELAGLPKLRRSIPYGVAWGLGQTLEGIYGLLRLKSEPRMTRFLAAQLATSHYFDISKSRRDFGYAAQISKAEGMDRLRDWLASNTKGRH